MLLRREPSGVPASGVVPTPDLDPAVIAGCLSVAVRDHVTAGGGAPEHRPVTVAFLHFDGTDEAIGARGPAAVADDLHTLVSDVQTAVDAQGSASSPPTSTPTAGS